MELYLCESGEEGKEQPPVWEQKRKAPRLDVN